MKKCSVPKCERKYKAKGYCNVHYMRIWRHGDPNTYLKVKTYCTIEGCEAQNVGDGLCQKHWMRRKRWGSPDTVNPTAERGEKSVHWQGNDITYDGAHRRVYSVRGKASDYVCSCGERARNWSYDHDCPDELSEVRRKGYRHYYSPNPERYTPMCLSCHRNFDLEMVKARREETWDVQQL